MRERKWDRELIVERIQQWHQAGVPVSKLYLQDPALTSSAGHLFGSWRAALLAAGLRSKRNTWSQQRVVKELKRRHRERQSVDANLYAAGKRYFGSMAKARAAAGLPPTRRVPAAFEWDEDSVIAAIQQRYQSGGNAALRRTVRETTALYAAAKRLFGGWKAARLAAGHPNPYDTVLPPDEVVKRIQELHAFGQPITNMQRRDPLLYRSARRAFDTWRGALRAAGLEDILPKQWSRKLVVAAILQRKAEGKELNHTWKEDKPLFRAAVNHFGGWTPAMQAAGLEPIRRERWTKRRVIERLQACEEKFGPVNIRQIDPNLTAAATRLFGTYKKAIAAADVAPSPRRWTKARVIDEIQQRYVNGGPRHIEGLGDIRLANASKRLFGSWAAAVDAAGMSGRIEIKKPLRRWTPADVIQEIREWHRSGRRLPELSRSNQSLYNAAKTHFGGWRNALHAAGFQSERRVWSKEAIIEEIRIRMDAGASLRSGHPDNRNLSAVAYRHFGSWRKALSAARVAESKQRRRGA